MLKIGFLVVKDELEFDAWEDDEDDEAEAEPGRIEAAEGPWVLECLSDVARGIMNPDLGRV